MLYEVIVLSAHRTPQKTAEYAAEAVEKGLKVIIAAAGGAAHLAGAIAARTTLPVIGIPVPSKHLGGLDSLLSGRANRLARSASVMGRKAAPPGGLGQVSQDFASLIYGTLVRQMQRTVRDEGDEDSRDDGRASAKLA